MTDELISREAAIAVAQSESQSNNPYISGLAMRLGERIRALPAADTLALGAVAMREQCMIALDDADDMPSARYAMEAIPLPDHAAQLAATLEQTEVADLISRKAALQLIENAKPFYIGELPTIDQETAYRAIRALPAADAEARHD